MPMAKEEAKFPGVATEGRKRKTQDRVLGFQSNCRQKGGLNDHRTTDGCKNDCVHYSPKAVVKQGRETCTLLPHVVNITWEA